MNRRQFVIATIFALISLTLAFTPFSIQVGTYDPWIDINEDGAIDGKDISILAKNFGTEGTPINKTAILLELQSKVEELIQNRTEIRIVIQTNATVERLSFNGMSITDVYTYNVTYGRTVLRYDGGLCIMMNQIYLAPATWAYPYLRIEIPLRVLISNRTISVEAFNQGGVDSITTVGFYNAKGMLVASFINRPAPSPYETEIFYIDSNGFFL